MSNPFTPPTVVGYNASPPSDDGQQVVSNQLNWSKHKDKLGDPLLTALNTGFSSVQTAFGKILLNNVINTAISLTVNAADQGKMIRATAAVTITTPVAATVQTPFAFAVRNDHTAAITIDGNGAETINGAATLSLAAGSAVLILTNGTNWFTVSGDVSSADIQNQTFTAFDDTGVVNAYLITPVPAITAYAKYQAWVVDIVNANTAASTMDINGLGVRNIFDFRTGAALVGGELAAGPHSFVDDGTQLILINSVVIPKLETYQFIETTDVTVNVNFPTGVVWSSSQSINIPTSGNMIFTVFARIDNADAAVRQFGFGLKIGGTNFWPQVDANGTATFNQYGVNVSEFRTWKGLSAPAAERTGLILNLDIEGHALPTGVQTVQPICAVNTGTSAHLIKGTLVTARMKLAVYNHA